MSSIPTGRNTIPRSWRRDRHAWRASGSHQGPQNVASCFRWLRLPDHAHPGLRRTARVPHPLVFTDRSPAHNLATRGTGRSLSEFAAVASSHVQVSGVITSCRRAPASSLMSFRSEVDAGFTSVWGIPNVHFSAYRKRRGSFTKPAPHREARFAARAEPITIQDTSRTRHEDWIGVSTSRYLLFGEYSS
jgi:hypothetical protein